MPTAYPSALFREVKSSVTSERDILQRLRRRADTPRTGPLVLGIGDDCAIFRPRAGEELLFTTDFVIEEVHFRWNTHTPAQVGYKALARGLSDIAAMGGKPRFCLVSLAVPKRANGRWIGRFYDGLLELAHATGTTLAGGDLAQAERVTCDIVVCGSAPVGTALRRSGARVGDSIYVSGALGGSALGLATGKGAAWKRHVRPEPRLALGELLRTKLYATAAMDLSDGLSIDLERLCVESGVSALITAPPAFQGASGQQALHGGEDYELLFTVRPKAKVPGKFRGLPLTRIGEVAAGGRGAVYLDGKRLRARGFDHFAGAL
ncbi:MAG: thiamine-monophosphate kinase [Bryobacterales bacterium]|nr:thiamine-monophosphate kinase [Bryobacterales bacterium]